MTSSGKKIKKITVYLRTGATGKEQPHEAFANLQDTDKDLAAFNKKWGPIEEGPGGAIYPYDDMQQGFVRHPRDLLRKAWRGDVDAFERINEWVGIHLVVGMQFHKRRLEIVPKPLIGTIFILFMHDHLNGRTEICANPDCANPYFIKKRQTQKYCESGPCTKIAQRGYARDWWNKHRAQNKRRKAS